MNPIWKERWLKALRSGQYRQGQGSLNRGGKLCCLGVLCDLVAKDGYGRWERDLDAPTVFRFKQGRENSRRGGLPTETQNLVGLSSQSELIRRNDLSGQTFTQIADYIEKEL
jgi:hypothetical protein